MSHAEQRGSPKPVRYCHNRLLWDEADVDNWLGNGQR
jgi:predicted DNA-binding transcriptional regulator AlpA